MHRRPPAPTRLALPALALLMLLSGCAGWRPAWNDQAEAVLHPVKGGTAAGLMTFRQVGAEVLMQGTFSGLTPGAHGLHIHEGGDCGGPEARNAGGHFNPTGARHGSPASPAHHLGDLPMLTAGQDGTARFQARMGGLSLDAAKTSILRRALIITAHPDNFTTQPTGNSGPPVACGVILPK